MPSVTGKQILQAFAYCDVSSGSVSTNSSKNLTVTRNSIGDYTCTFAQNQPDTNYLYDVEAGTHSPSSFTSIAYNSNVSNTETAPTVSAFRFRVFNSSANLVDPKHLYIKVFRP